MDSNARASSVPSRCRIAYVPFIIAQTANVTDDYQQRCAESGMDLFLSKPIQLDCLTASLHAAYNTLHSPSG